MPEPDLGQAFQMVVPSDGWFGITLYQPGSYCLAGCTMAPGFDVSDDAPAERQIVIKSYPAQHAISEYLTE